MHVRRISSAIAVVATVMARGGEDGVEAVGSEAPELDVVDSLGVYAAACLVKVVQVCAPPCDINWFDVSCCGVHLLSMQSLE